VETIIEFTDNKALEAGKIDVTRGDPEATRKCMFRNLEIVGGTGKVSGTFVLNTKLIFV
jgi:hypothetical protein